MVELDVELRLVEEALAVQVAERVDGIQDLHGDRRVVGRVDARVHGRETALAELPLEPVVREGLTLEQGRRREEGERALGQRLARVDGVFERDLAAL